MAAKKDFSQKINPVLNPALKFFSPTEPASVPAPENIMDVESMQQEKPTKAANVEKKASPSMGPERERKTKRLNLLLQPSTLEVLSKIAYMKQQSVNDLINSLLRDYVRENKNLSDQYLRIFSGEEQASSQEDV